MHTRKIMACLAVTLDGYIAGPKGEMDWLVRDESVDFGDILMDILEDIDAIFYGRISYELWGEYRPGSEASPKLQEAYKLLHSKKKYVFSKTITIPGSDAIFIHSDIKSTVSDILRQPGKNIWLYGGGKIVSELINLDLVDNYRLAVHPVIIGKGIPLFTGIERRSQLQLNEVKHSPAGVMMVNYSARKSNQ